MKEPEMKTIAGLIDRAVTARDNEAELEKVKGDVAELVKGFPLYAERRAEYKALAAE
jgi:glycine hydroxymethyltransferase